VLDPELVEDGVRVQRVDLARRVMTTRMTAEREANLQKVRAALSRARAMQLGLAVVMAVLSGVVTLALDANASTGGRILVYAFAALFGGLAALFVWVALVKSSPDRSPLMVALRERPDDVVWLYVTDVRVNVSGIDAPVRDCNVTSRLADGSTIAITVKKERAEELLAALSSLAPRAAVGFSEEREKQYKVDPRSVAQG
jgi:hypothetical protein